MCVVLCPWPIQWWHTVDGSQPYHLAQIPNLPPEATMPSQNLHWAVGLWPRLCLCPSQSLRTGQTAATRSTAPLGTSNQVAHFCRKKDHLSPTDGDGSPLVLVNTPSRVPQPRGPTAAFRRARRRRRMRLRLLGLNARCRSSTDYSFLEIHNNFLVIPCFTVFEALWFIDVVDRNFEIGRVYSCRSLSAEGSTVHCLLYHSLEKLK